MLTVRNAFLVLSFAANFAGFLNASLGRKNLSWLSFGMCSAFIRACVLELTLSPSLRDVLIADRELPSAIVMLDRGSFSEGFGF